MVSTKWILLIIFQIMIFTLRMKTIISFLFMTIPLIIQEHFFALITSKQVTQISMLRIALVDVL